jgi:hypothetical protein
LTLKSHRKYVDHGRDAVVAQLVYDFADAADSQVIEFRLVQSLYQKKRILIKIVLIFLIN